MGRILAIDYGRKRVGLAVTDPMQIIANGLETIPEKDVLNYLETYMQTEEIECFVVGSPKQLSNENSEVVKYLDPFIKRLKKRFPEIPVKLFDERFTSNMAFRTMIEGGLKKKARQNKALVDKVSATIILQDYMERRRNLPQERPTE